MAKEDPNKLANAGDTVELIGGGSARVMYCKIDSETKARSYRVEVEGEEDSRVVSADQIKWPEPPAEPE
jgi:hypothetical protein